MFCLMLIPKAIRIRVKTPVIYFEVIGADGGE
jgi:hypothetical protein